MAAPDVHRNVVTLGGDFPGAFSARYLCRVLPPIVSVELICDRNYFVFQPLLPEVSTATINALVLVIRRHDFLKIRDSLEVVDNYFKRILDKIYPPGIRARRADGE